MRCTNDILPSINTAQIDANGLRFEVDQCGDPSSRKLALCLHGFPEHSVSWRFQMPMLADSGYKVWAPNLRGYGNSSLPGKVSDYAIETLMADVGALIDAADVEETVLIAHDWGAVIAWYFAMREIRPLSHLIICNVPHPGAMRNAIGWEQLKRSWYVFFFQLPCLPEWMLSRNRDGVGSMMKSSAGVPENYPDEVIALYNENAARPGGARAMVNYYRALVRGGGAKRQADLGFPAITVPTLMCWGEDDVALSKETTYGTEQWVSELTIRYLPRMSHWVQQDAPEAVNAMIRAFIAGEPVPELQWRQVIIGESARYAGSADSQNT